MQSEASGGRNRYSDSLFEIANYLENLKEQPQANCSRIEWYQKGYQDGLNADKWIPVEEDMPMIDEYALVQDDEERIFIACIDSLDGEWRTNCHHVLRKGSVIAWQPLPTTYKKEGAE